MNRMFQALLLGLGAFAVTGLIVPATVSAVPGWYYVWTDYKTYTKGNVATLMITNPVPVTGSACANFVCLIFQDGTWLAIGWVEGMTPWGSTNGYKMYYYDQYVGGAYSGAFLGAAPYNTWHSFRVSYVLRTSFFFAAYLDGVEKKRTQFLYSTGLPETEAESHDSQDFMSGHVKDMKYALQSGRTMAWYPWDGYGSYGADPPYFISILSQTEWYYGVSG